VAIWHPIALGNATWKIQIGESLKIIDPENHGTGNQESLSMPHG
jgi:hypothetical protein